MGANSLNPSQQRYLYASLISFERALRLADDLLSNPDERGILYYRQVQLNDLQRQEVRERISQALYELKVFADRLGFEPKEENSAQMIMAEMSMSWVNLVDANSDRLLKYGDLSPEAAAFIDPAIEQLARIAIEFTRIVQGDSAANHPVNRPVDKEEESGL